MSNKARQYTPSMRLWMTRDAVNVSVVKAVVSEMGAVPEATVMAEASAEADADAASSRLPYGSRGC